MRLEAAHYEVEVKARVADHGPIRARLSGMGAVMAGQVRRCDTYYAPVALDPLAADLAQVPAFRLRREGEGRLIVTMKVKRIQGGVETNREVEFEVDGEAAFHEFAGMIGFAPAVRKVKEVEAWRSGQLLVELVVVEGLGGFVEVEGKASTEADASALHGAVLAMLDDLGVPREAIEPRPYVDLLRQRT